MGSRGPHSPPAYRGEQTGDGKLTSGNLIVDGCQAEGKGFAKFPNGDTYQGEFHLHLMDGRGTFTSVNGDVFEGMFKGHQRHGLGTLMHRDGEATIGTYEKSKLVGPAILWSIDRQRAVQLLNGKSQAEISLDEASKLAAEIGLPMPPEMPLPEATPRGSPSWARSPAGNSPLHGAGDQGRSYTLPTKPAAIHPVGALGP